MKIRNSIFLLLIFLLSGIQTVLSENKNLIKNGNFEEITSDGYLKYFSHFPTYGSGLNKYTNTFTPDNEAHSGRCSGKLTITQNAGFISQHGITLEPGAIYKFILWVKTNMNPIPPSKIVSKYKQGALAVLYPELPKNWAGPWPSLGYPNLSAGGGQQDWKKLTYYFKADKKFNRVWLALYVICPYGGTAWFDDISLTKSSEEEMQKWEEKRSKIPIDTSRNLLYNGSFELAACPDIPDNWGTGIGAPWFPQFQPWENRVSLEKGNAVDGTHFLRIKNFTIFSKVPSNIIPGEKLTLSFSARCNPSPGVLNIGCIQWKKFKIGKEWNRYTFHIDNRKKLKKTKVFFQTITKNTYFDIDAVHLHYGEKIVPYQPSEKEVIYKEIKKSITKGIISKNSPSIKCPLVTSEPKIDGQMDEKCWENSSIIKKLHSGNQAEPSQNTKIFICRDDFNLYIFFRCEEKNMNGLEISSHKNDYLVHLDDSVGITINPNPVSESNIYYKFVVNPDGVKAESIGEQKEWNCPWKCATYKGKKGWNVEISIPIAVLCENGVPDKIWGINFYRNRPGTSNRNGEKTYWAGKYETDLGILKILKAKEIYRFSPAASNPYYLWEKIGSEKVYTLLNVKKTLNLDWELHQTGKNNKLVKRGQLLKKGRNTETIYFKTFGNNFYITGKTRKGNIVYFKSVQNPTAPPLFYLYPPRYNYTVEEEKNYVKARINVLKNKNYKITFVLSDKNGKKFFQQEISYPKTINGVELKENLKQGEYQLSAFISKNNNKIFARQIYNYKKLSPVPPERKIQIDQWKRMIIKNEKPFLPVAFSFSNGWTHLDRLDEIKEHGFNTIFLWSTTIGKTYNYDITKVRKIIQKAHKVGLETIATTFHDPLMRPFTELSYKDIKNDCLQVIKNLKNEPGVLMWHHMDEVYSYWTKGKQKKESDLVDLYNACSTEDPYRPHFNNSFYSGKIYGGFNSTDLIHCTSYTIRELDGAPDTVSYAAGMRRVDKKNNDSHPIGIWLQYYIANDRLPSPDELKSMMYGCIIEGVRSFSFFMMRPLSNYLWKKTTEINSEIKSLTPVLYNGVLQSDIKCNNPSVHFIAYKYKNEVYIISVNLSYKPVKATFQSELYQIKKIKLLFENRKMQVKKSLYFSDKFLPLERHVYIISYKNE